MQKILQRNERMSQMLELISHIIKTKSTHPVPILLIQTFSHSDMIMGLRSNQLQLQFKMKLKINCKSKYIISDFNFKFIDVHKNN